MCFTSQFSLEACEVTLLLSYRGLSGIVKKSGTPSSETHDPLSSDVIVNGSIVLWTIKGRNSLVIFLYQKVTMYTHVLPDVM